MKLKDLYEYNKGIQDPNSNASQSKDDDAMEPMTPEEEREAKKSIKQFKIAGINVTNPNMMAKGLSNVTQGKKQTPQQVKQADPVSGVLAKIISKKENKPLKMRLMNIFKQVQQGDLEESTLAKKILRKLTGKKPLTKIKKRSKLLKEADPLLFEINFNQRSVAQEALQADIRCGFEAETFWFRAEGGGRVDDIDNMSVGDVEYEYGDLPDQAYSDYNDWVMEKGIDEYLPDIIANWVEENRDEDWAIQDFMSSDTAPTDEAVEEYRDEFKEQDPTEYENREEDGWDIDNWTRDLINTEYESEYVDFLYDVGQEEDQLRDDAVAEAESDYSMDEWISNDWYSMSSFLDDYGYDYPTEGGGVDDVADIFNQWIKNDSMFKGYPETGEYGETGTTDGWAVETDSSIDPDEGAGAELISPVYDTPADMLKDMKSLFDWNDQEEEFGTNNSTGLHVTMSWQGEGRDEPNKLKMALLVGDQYLLGEFDRLKNSYTKSQYNILLKSAEGMKRGDDASFKRFENELEKSISKDKFSSINFKDQKDRRSGNELIEFRIGGGANYNEKMDLITKSVIRYATVMKAGYDDEAFKKDYVAAVSRLMRKSSEIDPESRRVKDAELDYVNDPIIDIGKQLASKKEYFDILDYLNSSVKCYQAYQDLSKPGADKKWKKSIEDFRKGTGRDPSWMGEAINEEEITGYIEPSRNPPSVEAEEELERAQRDFVRALLQLAKGFSEDTLRTSISAKSIGIFRKHAQKLKMSDQDIDNLAKNNISFSNIDGKDAQVISQVKKGIDALFKKDIIQVPDFLSQQQAERLVDGMWQFFQNEDAKENDKLEELANLIDNATMGIDAREIRDILKQVSKSVQKNDFTRKIKGGGYDIRSALIDPGSMSNADDINKLEKFLSKYTGYVHPTGKTHHVNIRSDDDYHQVAQYTLVQKLRNRLDYLNELEQSDEPKAMNIQVQLIRLGMEFLNSIEYKEDNLDKGDSRKLLGIDADDSEYIKSKLDAYLTDPDDFNFTPFYNDYVLDKMEGLSRFYGYRKRLDQPEEFFKKPAIKKKIQNRFKAYKKFLDAFDKIFTDEGFQDLKPEIAGKDQYDKLNKDFEKNVRDNSIATLNIPSHSFAYIKKSYFDKLQNLEKYGKDEIEQTLLQDRTQVFDTGQNRTGIIYVIPAAHWSQVEDAVNGLELIDTFEKNKNYFHTWRKQGYKNIKSKFTNTYGVSFEKLIDPEGEYQSLDGKVQDFLKQNNIEITRIGDSRSGADGQEELIDKNELKNPNSGEPINRGSANMWDQTTDDAEQKRFDAFDFSYYPDAVKDYVAQIMKSDKGTNGSFQIALDKVLQKIVDREIDVDPSDLGRPMDRLARAAGVEDMEGKSSNEIASETNWTNLSDYLKIERGVNDQGVNLLKKVYKSFDGNHEWRPEPDPSVCCLPRWAAAVKASDEYIKDNYTVSAGNYFRKNVDGSQGDDVSSMYSNQSQEDKSDYEPEAPFEPSYEKARDNYFAFNSMMEMGMQNYLSRNEVNKLVAFLNNPDNDEEFKEKSLARLRSHYVNGQGAYDSFNKLLADTRVEMQNESVFDKFEKLPLQEQLRIVNESDILEKWSQKYKKSINCSNPKGFSQKAHCAGKKKKNEQIAEQQEIPTLDELKNDTMLRSINNVRTSYSKIAQQPWFEEVYNRALEVLKTSNNKFEFRSLLHVLIKNKARIEKAKRRKKTFGGDVRDVTMGVKQFSLANKIAQKLPKEKQWKYGMVPYDAKMPKDDLGENDFEYGSGKPSLSKEEQWAKFLSYRFMKNNQTRSVSDMESIIKRQSPKDFIALMRLKDKFFAGDQDLKTEGKLSKKEKDKKEKYVKGMKKSKGDFEKRYGADAKAVMYATATKMAKENKINTNMRNVFEDFEKLPLEKQLQLLQSPVAEKFFEQDWDNPTNDELEKEYQAAEKFVQDQKEEEFLKKLKKNKKYNRAKLLKKYTKLHGEETAKKMIWSMDQENKFESLIGIDILSRTKKLTENMPNNNKLAIIKRLLSKHFPVGDMDMQFQAYMALPIPAMMNAFSRLKSMSGDDACARDILLHFAKNRLPNADKKKIDLSESIIRENEEEKLDYIMQALKDNPDFLKKVYKILKLDKANNSNLDIEDQLSNKDTGQEKDHRINKNILRKLVTSLEQLDHDFEEINAFVESYGFVDYVDTGLLNKSGVFTIKDMLKGSDKVSKEFIYDLYESLYDFRLNISGSNRGPGELGLCLLSPNIELASVGDIKVNGEEIEVKGEVSTGGGRMVNGVDDFEFSGLAQVKNRLMKFYDDNEIPDEDRIYNLKGAVGGGNKQGQAHILDQAQRLENIKQGVGAPFLRLIVSTYKFVVGSDEEEELVNSFMSLDKTRFLTLIGRISFKNYAYKLNEKGFNRLIFLNWLKDKVVNCTTEEFPEYSEHLAFTSLDMADSQNGPAVQVSVK
tara:strand:+ start:4430 stop:11707 length:7278 start_codon:yes stop_codon:yes gene_type:complete